MNNVPFFYVYFFFPHAPHPLTSICGQGDRLSTRDRCCADVASAVFTGYFFVFPDGHTPLSHWSDENRTVDVCSDTVTLCPPRFQPQRTPVVRDNHLSSQQSSPGTLKVESLHAMFHRWRRLWQRRRNLISTHAHRGREGSSASAVFFPPGGHSSLWDIVPPRVQLSVNITPHPCIAPLCFYQSAFMPALIK